MKPPMRTLSPVCTTIRVERLTALEIACAEAGKNKNKTTAATEPDAHLTKLFITWSRGRRRASGSLKEAKIS
jgi:hypothetical protein